MKCITEHPHLFFFSSWMQEAYDSFFSDFGPVNIALVARFCDFMKQKMQDPRIAQRHSRPQARRRAAARRRRARASP